MGSDLVSVHVLDGTLGEQIRGVIIHLFPRHQIIFAEVEVPTELFAHVVCTGSVLAVKGIKPSVVRGLVQVTETLKSRMKLVEVLLYVHRNRRFIRDGSQGRPHRLSHSS